ncbi:MAG: DJ-1/PfpI family protein [Verrucomicrobia bacterium]|nr:DJ-1/PfpI family protein [Verrucomicrobiota bacterium]MCG2681749.1 DJ-1/PfpI family protein [Kiritimatiellia bacterium]MBU4247163.1 DJ-1/PfpI family protein [Verrucomicrobiota bacterium]MBU4291067.1 DJ-1/PfpI family protein [Verrucomicrobiota bacterium]MBU4429714.1 DJ-1/PfpI family protein [Verrucomicrobiota bacterium]
MTSVLVPLADGSEEMEAVIAIDVFRRVPWSVTSVGIRPGVVTGSRRVRLVPDAVWTEVEPSAFDILVIPGGQAGAEALSRDERILEAVRFFVTAGKWVAAICAGPLVLQAAGVLAGRRATCHPAVTLTQTERREDRVVVDGRLITSQGPGTSFEFVLAIVREVEGTAKAAELAKSMVVA